MQQLSNIGAISHWKLVELATRLMSGTPGAQRFLPSYDAALAAENDRLLLDFCRGMSDRARNCRSLVRAA
jgi:hypothetical protein